MPFPFKGSGRRNTRLLPSGKPPPRLLLTVAGLPNGKRSRASRSASTGAAGTRSPALPGRRARSTAPPCTSNTARSNTSGTTHTPDGPGWSPLRAPPKTRPSEARGHPPPGTPAAAALEGAPPGLRRRRPKHPKPTWLRRERGREGEERDGEPPPTGLPDLQLAPSPAPGFSLSSRGQLSSCVNSRWGCLMPGGQSAPPSSSLR